MSGGIGQILFAPDGTLSGITLRRDVCEDGTVGEVVEGIVGTHVQVGGGDLLLDVDPTMPGTETTTVRLSFDHERMLIGHANDTFPSVGLVLRRPTGATPALLDGTYAYTRQVLAQVPGGTAAASGLGTLAFDGLGTFTLVGVRHIVTPTASAEVPVSDAGPYALTSDGVLALGATPHLGFVSQDGEVLVWIERVGVQVALAVAVKREGSYSADEFFGPWDLAAMAVRPGTDPDEPKVQQITAQVDLDGAGAAFSLVGEELEATPLGTSEAPNADSGTFVVQSDGGFLVQSNSGPQQSGALDVARSTALVAELLDPERTELGLLLRRLVPAKGYGTATAGSGGIDPVLDTVGGLSFLGNAAFGFEVSDALGQAPVLVALSAAPTNGLPSLGGTLWVDPGQLTSTLLGLAMGPAGVPGAGTATVPSPIPSDPVLAGAALYAQAVVVDAGGPSGFAWSRGLAFQIW